jgi:hypothetical protein
VPGDMLFGESHNKVRPTIDNAENLLDRLLDIHIYAHQHLKLATYRKKLVATDLSTERPTTRTTKCGSIVQPARNVNRRILNPHGTAHMKYLVHNRAHCQDLEKRLMNF